jgi:hypothetical protein
MGTTNNSPGMRFRLILGESIAVGPGEADLLAAIADFGSISAALAISSGRLAPASSTPITSATMRASTIWREPTSASVELKQARLSMHQTRDHRNPLLAASTSGRLNSPLMSQSPPFRKRPNQSPLADNENGLSVGHSRSLWDPPAPVRENTSGCREGMKTTKLIDRKGTAVFQICSFASEASADTKSAARISRSWRLR